MNEDTVEETMKLPEAETVVVAGQEGTLVQKEQYQAEDVAAAFFRLNSAKFEKLLSEMAPYQIRRAVMNACTYPFIDKEYNPETQEEKTFAYLVHELLMNKVIMQLAFEMDKADDKVNKQETKEDTNGTMVP